jgi:transcription elongation GreA/GreB family factor
MDTVARISVGSQATARSCDTESNRKSRVIGPDDARSDSAKVISAARKVAARHSALLEKLSQ